MEILNLTVFISQHPSGGFTLDVPCNLPEKAMKVIDTCAVWRNGCSREGYKQFEFVKGPFWEDLWYFKLWVQMSLETTIPLLNLEIKIQ